MHVANALHAPVHLPVVVKAPKPLAIVQATTTRETLIPHPKPNPNGMSSKSSTTLHPTRSLTLTERGRKEEGKDAAAHGDETRNGSDQCALQNTYNNK